MLDPATSASLDPSDWAELRREGHRMLDGMFDHLQGLRDQPLWRDPSSSAHRATSTIPIAPTPLAEVHEAFAREILLFSSGNAHPGFMGWVQGGGAPVGMLAEMLAAGLNANLGGRNHMPLAIEREVLGWTRELFGFPEEAEGLFVTGTSAANHIGVLVALTRALGPAVKRAGLGGARLTAYASAATHGCVDRALQMVGLGSDALRRIPVDQAHRIHLSALSSALARDRKAGFTPFLLVGNAGTVDIGATDDLEALADVALAHDLHFHVDGAFGALGMLSDCLRPRLRGVERADSLGFDWHKWGQVPYDAGFALVRDGQLLRETFAADAGYLRRAPEGLAAGEWWPCDYGPDLSRGFKALKVWFMLKTYGAAALGRVVDQGCALAERLAAQVANAPELELLAPVPMNIVAFSWAGPDADRLNPLIVGALHREGRVAPSLTTIGGRSAIRACFINHRSEPRDVDALMVGVLRVGRAAGTLRAAA